VLVLVLVLVLEFGQPQPGLVDDKSMLDHERLDVYQCAIRFAALSFQILEGLPRGNAQLADQLLRATMSIPLNIAEGCGKTSLQDRARYHAIARGSAMECAAIFDLLGLRRLATPSQIEEGKALLVRIVGMLTKMCR
jgi:four helix bundle protein